MTRPDYSGLSPALATSRGDRGRGRVPFEPNLVEQILPPTVFPLLDRTSTLHPPHCRMVFASEMRGLGRMTRVRSCAVSLVAAIGRSAFKTGRGY